MDVDDHLPGASFDSTMRRSDVDDFEIGIVRVPAETSPRHDVLGVMQRSSEFKETLL